MIYKGKEYGWVNEVLRAGVYYTLWRQHDDPEVCVMDTSEGGKPKKVEELKIKAKDKWKEVLDKPKVLK